MREQNSMDKFNTENRAWLDNLPECPEFSPTVEEFEDPLEYIRRIQTEAEAWGICKVRPPIQPNPDRQKGPRNLDGTTLKFTTRQQPVRERIWKDLDNVFEEEVRPYTLARYQKVAYEAEGKLLAKVRVSGDPRSVELEYWRQRVQGGVVEYVEYGNDVEGTAFSDPHDGDPLGSSKWNMQTFSRLGASSLRLLHGEAPGISTPMLYIGMAFATFAWHVEDHYLYSINYQHFGAPKTWYGVPARAADQFEEVARHQVYGQALKNERIHDAKSKAHAALLRKTTMFSPKLLVDAGVPVCRAVQRPGDFIITFPRGYHAGFSNGYCVGEAVNFAMHDWYQYGADAALRYRRLRHPPILPHEQLLCKEALQLVERMRRGKASRNVQADVSLAGTFVRLMREQNKACHWLIRRGLQQRATPEDFRTMDCCLCACISYMAVVSTAEDGLGDGQPMCTACAFYENVQGANSTLFRHPSMAELEAAAQWLEKQPLLQCADWGRGIEERGVTEIRHHSKTALQVTPPNMKHQWHPLQPVQPDRCPKEPDEGIRNSADAIMADIYADCMDLGLDAMMSDDEADEQQPAQPLTLMPPPYKAIAPLTEPAVPGPILGHTLVTVQPAPLTAAKLQPAEASPGGGNSAGSDATTMIPAVHESSSDEDVEVDVVGTSAADPAARWQALESEPAPVQHHSSSGGAEQKASREEVKPAAPADDTPAAESKAAVAAVCLEVQEDSSDNRGFSSSHKQTADEQASPSSTTDEQIITPSHADEQADTPSRVEKQADPLSQAEKQAVAPPQADQQALAASQANKHAEAPSQADKEPEAPSQAQRRDEETAAGAACPASEGEVAGAPGSHEQTTTTGAEAASPRSTGSEAAAAPQAQSELGKQSMGSSVTASTFSSQGRPWHRNMGVTGGLLDICKNEMLPFDGRPGGAPRTVYCMTGSPETLLMRALDIARFCGWAVGSDTLHKISSIDLVNRWWRTAHLKRLRALELGIEVPELPGKPLRYHCEADADVSRGFCVSLEDIIRIVHWVSNSEQRAMLEAYCGPVWPDEYAARAASLPAVEGWEDGIFLPPSQNRSSSKKKKKKAKPAPNLKPKPKRKRSPEDASGSDQPSDNTTWKDMEFRLPEDDVEFDVASEDFDRVSKRLKAQGAALSILQYLQSL